ncbi:MAG TPA: DNA repair protein RadC [Saprospiraceae bacterium]|nr:DNA repair protein RadC [Saprospiraceae bacterium]
MPHLPQSIKNLPLDDRPRERAVRQGISALSDSELIAILIGSGSQEINAVTLARQIMQSAGNDLHLLAKMSIQELQKHKGVGIAKAVTIAASMELGRRRWSRDVVKRSDIRSSGEAYDLIMPHLIDKKQEEFWMILLNQACKVLHYQIVSTGGVAHVPVDIKTILKAAVEHGATQIILAHNHPSGRTVASQADITLTERLVNAAKLMDIRVIDHIIIGENGYFSFADENMI